MSRIGKKPINIPNGIKINLAGNSLTVEGPKGKLEFRLPQGISAEIKDNLISLNRAGQTKSLKSLHGMARSLIFNMIKGASEGYVKELEIQGVGFKGQAQGENLVLNLRFSHSVNFPIPEGIKIQTPKPTQIIISGIDKAIVGDTAARIRRILPPEPYKGKGIRYAGEFVRKKIGKAATK